MATGTDKRMVLSIQGKDKIRETENGKKKLTGVGNLDS
jgi:hypothetical protein